MGKPFPSEKRRCDRRKAPVSILNPPTKLEMLPKRCRWCRNDRMFRIGTEASVLERRWWIRAVRRRWRGRWRARWRGVGWWLLGQWWRDGINDQRRSGRFRLPARKEISQTEITTQTCTKFHAYEKKTRCVSPSATELLCTTFACSSLHEYIKTPGEIDEETCGTKENHRRSSS